MLKVVSGLAGLVQDSDAASLLDTDMSASEWSEDNLVNEAMPFDRVQPAER